MSPDFDGFASSTRFAFLFPFGWRLSGVASAASNSASLASARWVLAGFAMLWVMTATGANAQQKWRVQQQTRSLAAEMITSVLDIQLRQLRENRLTDLRLYDEILELRGNVDQMVSNEMQQVVTLLNSPLDADVSSQQRRMQQARHLVRQIVVALLAERHRIRRRLQVSRTNALVRQLIDAQTEILDETRSLPARPPSERAAQTLETLQDQRDARAIYVQLVKSLVDTSTWGGQLAADAASGLESLDQAEVESRLEQAVQTLTQAQFRAASEHQRAVITGLRTLLRRLNASQGLDDAARDQAEELVGKVIQQQRRVRQATREAELEHQDQQDRLGARQREVEQALQGLAETLPASGRFPILVAQAQRASRDAELKLFEAHKESALTQQGVVLETLAQLQQQLRLADPPQNKTSEQLAMEQQALEQLDQDLGDLMDLQAEATEQSAGNPAAAAEKERRVGNQLERSAERSGIPESIQTTMQQTQQAVAESQLALQDPTAQAADSRRQATERAESALRELAAQVKAALGDAAPSQSSDQQPPGNPASNDSSENAKPAESASRPQDEGPASESQSNSGVGESAGTESTDSRAADSNNDASRRIRNLESEPWFSKLPTAVQQAMRAVTRRKPPPGYEERLRRYFQRR